MDGPGRGTKTEEFVKDAIVRREEDVPRSAIVKAYAAVHGGAMARKELTERVGGRYADLLDGIEDGWERLAAMRQSNADAHEEAIAGLERAGVPERIVGLAREGRIGSPTIAALQRAAGTGDAHGDGWPEEVREAIRTASQIRRYERLTNLVDGQERPR